VLAAGAALGIGAYQAVEEFRRYEEQVAAHGAGLTSDDPSMAWVIVAVVGAGIDAAAFASALPKLRPALEAFNIGPEAGAVASLQQKLARLAKVEDRIKNSIVRAAEAEADARAAWKAVFRPPASLRAVIVPGAEEFGRLVFAIYQTIRRGIREFDKFVTTNEAINLIGDVAKLAPEELAALKLSYLKGIEEMEAVAAHGRALGLNENEVRAFMNLRGNTKGMSVPDVMKEMDSWKATKASGVPFGFKTGEEFARFRSTAAAELKKLLKKVDRNAEAYLQGSAVTGVSYKRHLPFDPTSDFDIAVSSRALFRQAERTHGFEVKLNPRHIGPLSPEEIAELGLKPFWRKLSEVATPVDEATGAPTGAAREIRIMLFENEEAVRKPLGQASLETERASIRLQGD